MPESYQLIVMRHAKAAELPGGADFDRPLRPRGETDSAAAGQWLAARGYLPDLAVCSAALRTRQTCQAVLAQLPAAPPWLALQELYQGGPGDVLGQLHGVFSPRARTVLYVGHNPAVAAVAELLTGTDAGFPTAGTAVIGLAVQDEDVVPGSGELLAKWSPAEA